MLLKTSGVFSSRTLARDGASDLRRCRSADCSRPSGNTMSAQYAPRISVSTDRNVMPMTSCIRLGDRFHVLEHVLGETPSRRHNPFGALGTDPGGAKPA